MSIIDKGQTINKMDSNLIKNRSRLKDKSYVLNFGDTLRINDIFASLCNI